MIKEIKSLRYLRNGDIQLSVILDDTEDGMVDVYVTGKGDRSPEGKELYNNAINNVYGGIEPFIELTKQELYERDLGQCYEKRSESYGSESDPLRMEYEYEKEVGTEESIAEAKQKWIDKVQEIKARYPKPEANTIKG